MSEHVTDEDRKAALHVIRELAFVPLGHDMSPAAGVVAAALAAEREKARARYEEWLTELHQNDGYGYCVECERPTPNGCTTILELHRIRRAAEEGQQ